MPGKRMMLQAVSALLHIYQYKLMLHDRTYDGFGRNAFMEHETLQAMACAFGLDAREAKTLVSRVLAQAGTLESKGMLPLKTWRSRLVVHACIVRLGQRLFSKPKSGAGGTSFASLHDRTIWERQRVSSLQMPLTYRAVYILEAMFAFSEKETSEVLNISIPAVRERYRKALAWRAKETCAYSA